MFTRALIACVVVSFVGCAPTSTPRGSDIDAARERSGNFPKDKYAAEFRVLNLSDHKIVMNRCDGFEGWASPDAGNLIPNAEKGSVFPPISEFPAQTTIHWHDEQDGQDYDQTVELANVVPRGVDGVTVLEFGKDQKWSVRFEPKTSATQE